MESTFSLEPVLRFLTGLSQNNNKAWFDQNRAAYDNARVIFERFVEELIDEFRASDDLQGLAARDCMFRINRDIRFAKDKSPYKTNMSALIAPGGRKNLWRGYYVAVGPLGQSLVGGGLHSPTPEELTRFRQAIDRDATPFKKLIAAPTFTESFGALEGERLKTAPQGYDRTHPEIELLQLKQIMVARYFADAEVLAPAFPDRVGTTCRAMKPFLDYLGAVLE
jgi:uncharacterized protein (TIGR02453 family)